MKNVAVVLAAGKGRRAGLECPKQFLTLDGQYLLEYSVDAFHRNRLIDEIVIVVSEEYIPLVTELKERNQWSGVKHIICGGEERYHSTLAAVDVYSHQEDCNFYIHDAARPLVSDQIITNCVHAMERYSAADVAIPVADTIVESNDNGTTMNRLLNRDMLYSEQTPQAFRRSILEQAYRLALEDPLFHSTDDCGTVMRYLPHIPIAIIPGESTNIKVTYPGDIAIVEWLIKERRERGS